MDNFLKVLTNPILVFMLLCGIGAFLTNRYIPPQHLPWKTLDINRETGFATRAQLLALQLKDRSVCTALMDKSALDTSYVLMPEKEGEGGCGWTVALNNSRMRGMALAPPKAQMICPMSAASYIWLGDVNEIALKHYDSPLTKIYHYGSYSCRNVAGTNRRSEHAFGNAWDIYAFEMENGHIVNIKLSWTKGGKDAEFLRDSRDAACKIFRTTLGPDYNAAHADHFHLDMGPYTICN